ncbi:LysM-like peptidoglycan-binding domain-containing protein [Pasteurella skyensis]|uniref:LysM-like peptidoglycan-binding domain-containing protein n=1 Tax=Phocoenobacter skyensis TaxID=97481 RepID=A0AAJ6N9N8_9PAST|nr:LysM-like peptidoglycan-binding domain-containing protein [Pasteurella skyensis]MDP8162595.1 LysM-like peptidoglycan-binding domain-containing protein [Pasteurella skyensis]MDP8172807.1 LysM-like peptidoglycan-binding domain-containing protein [Pasteurella skyensis]MDP8177349.1 LysM-like peptidoglycan-binding domain-containing protein [Pasteurella skyensis]MDP8179276.1 LysM-like peptidoglycan-binding domain-containing protein [Pasteurella skyensis]MDP8183477.1 LysM-like peptidoglycan-bindin
MSDNNIRNEQELENMKNLENSVNEESKSLFTDSKPSFSINHSEYSDVDSLAESVSDDVSLHQVEMPFEPQELDPKLQSDPPPIAANLNTNANVDASERVISVSQNSYKEKISQLVKYKRFFIALLAILLLLVLFWALKPSTPKVVEELEQQGNIPEKFRPIDENEAKLAEQQEILKSQAQVDNDTQPTDVIETRVQMVEDDKIPSEEVQVQAILKAQQEKIIKPNKNTATIKHLTMKSGVSLMQLFRDHHINIVDLTRMTKVTGAKKVFRRLNVGDKVVVHLNSQGRVATMDIKDGQFVLQSNGTYIYKK